MTFILLRIASLLPRMLLANSVINRSQVDGFGTCPYIIQHHNDSASKQGAFSRFDNFWLYLPVIKAASQMGLLDLFSAASIPVLKVLLVTALGSYLALDRVNILGEDARKHLNGVGDGRSLRYILLSCITGEIVGHLLIVFYVFNPAIVSSNLANTITYDSMVKLWFMPFNILITFLVGSVLGWLVIQMTRAPRHLHGLVIGCCAAGNLGNMLLIIIPAVCKEKGSPFGAPDVCHSYGMAYASLSMAIGAIFLWSYVYNTMRISSSKSSKEVEISDSSVIKSPRESYVSPPGSCTDPLLHSDKLEGFEDYPDQLALPSSRLEDIAQESLWDKTKQHVEMVVRKVNLKRLFAPSTTGAIVGFVVGLVPQFRRFIIGDAAPLRVIHDTALLLGDGAIPALTLIMGGNLLKGTSLQVAGVPKSLIAGILIARYIVLPMIGVAAVKVALQFGLVHNNPLYQFVLLLQYAVPPAMNIGTITQLFGAGESECSVIMLWTYALASVALTFWSTFFFWLVA